MCAKGFRKLMNGVGDAQTWANKMVQRESRGPGDMENAMRRLETRYGIPWRIFWALRYRAPEDVFVGVYRRLQAAYQSECDRQEGLMRHERKITQAKVLAFASVDRAGVPVDGEENHE